MKLQNPINFNTLFTLALVCFSALISAIAPPFTSPDEADHVKRAYFLTKGQIILESVNGSDSGGMLDSGMYDYINSYYSELMADRQHKFSQDEINYSSSISWSGEEKFSAAPGTNYYFPVIYAPQAIGLFAGEKLGLSVDKSYRLARFLATISSGIVLLLAFRIYAPPPLVLFYLALPMSLFQIASSSIDGITTAIAILSISIFLKISEEPTKSKWSHLIFLSFCITVLLTSRIHMLPMVGLIFATMYYTKNTKGLVCGALSLFFIFTWLLIGIKSTVDSRVFVGAKTSDVILYYLKDPLAFFSVLFRTILDQPSRSSYLESFIGILGWLDAPLSKTQYSYYYISAIIPLILNIQLAQLKKLLFARFVLIACSATSVLFIFFALLVTYNYHPANLIGGVQGRYFIIPMILASYTIGFGSTNSIWLRSALAVFMIVFMTASSYTTLSLLLNKYYVNEYAVKLPRVTKTEVTLPLSKDTPITIKLGESYSSLVDVKRIGIMFATWARVNQGTGKITFHNSQDKYDSSDFDLSKIEDNKYAYFNIEISPVTSAEIVSTDGGGISIWQAKYDNDNVSPCVIFEFKNGARKYTPGCPTP